MAAGSTYTPIATTTLGSGTNSVTFSSLGSYTDIILVASTSYGSTDVGLCAQFNGDTGNNYSTTALYGTGSSAASFRESSTNRVLIGRQNSSQSTSIAHFQNYANSTINKTVLSRGNDSALVIAHVGLWRNTAAITSIRIFDENSANFNSGSTFTLYGIQAA